MIKSWLFVSAWPKERHKTIKIKVTLDLNVRVVRRSHRFCTLLCSSQCCVWGGLSITEKCSSWALLLKVGLLSPLPVDAAEILGSLGLFFNVRE